MMPPKSGLTHLGPVKAGPSRRASHNIRKLRGLAEDLDRRLVDAWPRYHRRDKRGFEILRRAYVEASYSEHYEITVEELEWLEERVGALQEVVEVVCRKRLGE